MNVHTMKPKIVAIIRDTKSDKSNHTLGVKSKKKTGHLPPGSADTVPLM